MDVDDFLKISETTESNVALHTTKKVITTSPTVLCSVASYKQFYSAG